MGEWRRRLEEIFGEMEREREETGMKALL
jgi:hypothetical protein